MKKLLFVLLVIAFAVPATAETIIPVNTRPTTVSVSSEPSLQSLLNSIYSCTDCVNMQTDQEAAGMWGIISAGVIAPKIRFEYAGYAPDNTFGIWSGTDSTSITSAQIFAGAASPTNLSSATIEWQGASSGIIYNSTGTIATFTEIPWWSFGFYLGSPQGTFYSVDQLNSGLAQMVAYRHTGSNTWVLGWEDIPASNPDRDYNDFVVSIESLVPVPEPTSMMLLGTGLVGLAAAARRRIKK